MESQAASLGLYEQIERHTQAQGLDSEKEALFSPVTHWTDISTKLGNALAFASCPSVQTYPERTLR